MSSPSATSVPRFADLFDGFIPIFSGMKNKRRKKEQRRRSSRDRRGDYYEDSGSPHGPREGPREARYNDMAPK